MKSRVAIIAAVLFLSAAGAYAHHSFAGTYQEGGLMKIEGKVVEFNIRNPHSFILADVEAPGGKERWAIEMTAPANLVQEGWKRTSLKAGDKVTIWVHPLRSGAKGGSYAGVRLADGKTLGDAG